MKALDIGIAGAGFAGAAAALFLAEYGHQVTLYEEAEKPQPVGAGILMQPSGLSVLADLGLLEGALERGARVDSLVCKTPSGRSVLELSYRDLFEDWFGLGMHRGALFELLHGQLALRGVKLVTGASVQGLRQLPGGIRPVLADASEPAQHELLVVADGARSALRRTMTGARATPYPWGARWYVGPDPSGIFAGKLQQMAHGTHVAGLLAVRSRPAPHRRAAASELVLECSSQRARPRLRLDGLEGARAVARSTRRRAAGADPGRASAASGELFRRIADAFSRRASGLHWRRCARH